MQKKKKKGGENYCFNWFLVNGGLTLNALRKVLGINFLCFSAGLNLNNEFKNIRLNVKEPVTKNSMNQAEQEWFSSSTTPQQHFIFFKER